MSPAVLAQMRQHQIGVLVDLVGVLGAEASFSGEGELGHAIVKLLLGWLGVRLLWNRLRGGHFSRDGGSDGITVATLGSFASAVCTISVGILSFAFLRWELTLHVDVSDVLIVSILIDLGQMTLHRLGVLVQ